MGRHYLRIVAAFVGAVSCTTLAVLFARVHLVRERPAAAETPEVSAGAQPEQLLRQNWLRQRARAISVKIFSGEQQIGSGVLLQQRGETYWLATNHHVLLFARDDRYQVQTSDGLKHEAEIVASVRPEDIDLRVLQFRSSQGYVTAPLALQWSPVPGQEIYAAGFPFDPDPEQSGQFAFTAGNLVRYSELAFGGGYQIGYENDIRKGMSGGPMLNAGGQLVGINGTHKNPLWGNPYIFTDGSQATGELREQMSQLSWGIPVETLIQTAPQLVENEELSSLERSYELHKWRNEK